MDGAIAIALFTTDDRDGMVDQSIDPTLSRTQKNNATRERKQKTDVDVDQRWIEWKKLSRHLTLALFSSPSANAKWFAFATPAFRIAKADSTTLRLYDSASIWLYQRHAIGSSAGPRIVIALTMHSLSHSRRTVV